MYILNVIGLVIAIMFMLIIALPLLIVLGALYGIVLVAALVA